MGNYKPQGKNKEILDRAMDYRKSVPYRPSLRWLFYRLFQDGIYQNKENYKDYSFQGLFSQARKRFYGEWNPTTLKDDTSGMIQRVGFFKDLKDLEGDPDLIANMIEVTFDPFYELDRYTIIGFEARAMVEQFEYYTEGINLLPFGGDAHIEMKWKIAKHFEDAYQWYGSIPLDLLYFGDYDKKGSKIYKSAQKDIQKWCKYPINFVWCGLTEEQAKGFNLPENPEKKGQYQWESLTDPQAKEIIFQSLARNRVDTKLIKAKIKEGERVTKEWREKVKKAL